MELGWQLLERLPGLLIEAEAHAVWKSNKTERRVDVTPKEIRGINRIVFLPDPSLVYEKRQINSVRAGIVDDTLITDLIAALDEQFEILNRDDRADFHGDLVATPELLANAERQVGLLEQIRDKYFAEEPASVETNP